MEVDNRTVDLGRASTLSLSLVDEGLGFFADFADFSPENDGADSGVSTPEVFSPLHESFMFDDDLANTAGTFNDLLKPFAFGPTPSLPELPQIPLDLGNFPLDDLCAQLDIAGAADFTGLLVDDATSILNDLVLGPVWDPKLLAQNVSLLMLHPPTTFSVSSEPFAASSSINPTLVDNVQQQSSEDEEDEIDVVTVDDIDAIKNPVKLEPQTLQPPPSPIQQQQPQLSTPPTPSTPPTSLSAVDATSISTTTTPSALGTALPPTLVTPPPLHGLPPLAALNHMGNQGGLPPLMSFPGAANFGSISSGASTNGSTRSNTPNGNKYHPYALQHSSGSAHTPKRNTERKRQLHNELERKRREDLNMVFNALGDVIPDLHNINNNSNGSPNGNGTNGAPAKGSAPTQTQILQGATDYLQHLKETHAELMRQKEEAIAEQAALRARLLELTGQAA